MREEKSLNDIKKEYSKLQKKYSLPSFEKLNEEFGIEKITEGETDFLLRKIRSQISEKFFSYLRFTETLLNPANAPMFVFSIVKAIDSEKRKNLNEIYKNLAKNEINVVEIDLDYSEEKEAEYIKDSHKLWLSIKKDMLEVIECVKKNWDNKTEGKSKGYFG